jgi:hypothetical protein
MDNENSLQATMTRNICHGGSKDIIALCSIIQVTSYLGSIWLSS